MTPSEKQNAQLVIVTGFIVLHLLFKSVSLLYFAAVLGVVFLFIPTLGELILKGWFKLSEILGWFSSRVLLSIVFYCFLFPIASISKLFTGNTLNRKNTDSTLFAERNHKFQKEDMENVW